MRKILMVGAIFAALAIPTASQAQISLGARLGYGFPMGDAAKDVPLDDFAKSQIPIQLDAMYKLTPDLSFGAYFSYAFVQLNSDLSDGCDALGQDCSASIMRFGVQGAYAFNAVSQSFVPWVGAGIGYEMAKIDLDGFGNFDSDGWEYLNLQGGVDFKVMPKVAIGPYAQFSIGQFSKQDGEDIPDKAMHEWLSFGVRGTFDL